MLKYFIAFVACVATLAPAAERDPIYQDDPAITKLLAALEPGQSAVLPAVNVKCGDIETWNFPRVGPGQRDYCNKMPYAPDRRTALYAGGNHRVPHRMNDVWEYHLGSNTWHLLYEPDGGNPSPHKGAYFLTSRTLVRDPDKKLTEKEQDEIAAYKTWWNENVVFQDGHLCTTRGGPIMPAHTWDAFTYDAKTGLLLWGMGVSPAGQLSTQAYFTGKPVEHWEKQADETYTPMWMFDVKKKKWIHYRTTEKHAALRGMGATMCYLPGHKKTIWYVSAQNVSPAAYEMWLFDGDADKWTELKPNGGKSIGELSTKEKVAPMSELQTAYSAKHQKMVAVLKHETFVYDVAKNHWSKAVTDERIFAHDARTVFAYDEAADVFLLAYPKGDTKFAAFSLETGKWKIIQPDGPAFHEARYGGEMGYYDPVHNVFVLQRRGVDKMWVYRHASR